MRTPNAPKWDDEPLASDIDMGGERDWNTSDGWDDGQVLRLQGMLGVTAAAASVTRGAPLAPDEMPPWLRRGPENGASAAEGRMDYADDARATTNGGVIRVAGVTSKGGMTGPAHGIASAAASMSKITLDGSASTAQAPRRSARDEWGDRFSRSRSLSRTSTRAKTLAGSSERHPPLVMAPALTRVGVAESIRRARAA